MTEKKTPIPAKLPSDADILFEDVRQVRKRRWAIATMIITVVGGALLTLFILVFSTGQSVGAAQKDLEHIERTQASAQKERNDLRREQLQAERENAQRFNAIRDSLHSIDRRLGRMEQRVEDMNGRRYRR